MEQPSVFISYSHKDQFWKGRLVTHLGVLQRQGLLETWDDNRLRAGDEWEKEIETALSSAQAAVLMISADFLTSDFVTRKEIPQILALRQKQGLKIIPIVVAPCYWKAVPWLAALQMRPKGAAALTAIASHEAEAALADVAAEVHRLMERASIGSPQKSTASAGDQLKQVGPTTASQRVALKTTKKVGKGEIIAIALEVQKGDVVVGTIEETYGNSFDFFVVDEITLNEFFDQDYLDINRIEDGGTDEGGYSVHWKVPRKGPWHLILSAKWKKKDRKIRVDLKALPKI